MNCNGVKKFAVSMFLLMLCTGLGFSMEWYEENYESLIDAEDIPEECLLQKKEEPKFYFFSGDSTLEEFIGMRSNKYLKVIGYTGCLWSYNGNEGAPAFSKEKQKKYKRNLRKLVEEYRPKIVLVGRYLISEKDAGYDYTSRGDYYGSSYYGLSHGISSSRASVRSVTRTTLEYDVLFCCPYSESEISQWKFGIEARDLLGEEQKALKRNTGAYVGVVFNKYPAFYAEMQSGDIIIQLDDSKIRNTDDLFKFESKAQEGDVVKVLLLRDGREMTLEMEL